jgi:hypothetical protein
MGARRRWARAAVSAAVLACAARSGASTVTEPIARLSLEGGYDSNVLYQGTADTVARVSPELGLRARDHLWDLSAAYGADWIRYQRLAPRGEWNHRLRLALDSRPSRRSRVTIDGRGAYALDPLGLALMGIFVSGERAAWTALARGHGGYRITERIDAGVSVEERLVRFDDGTGSAMHAAGASAAWRWTHRLSVGGEYRLAAFQDFGKREFSLANALRGRLDYQLSRRARIETSAGPALWTGPDARALVPEANATLLVSDRFDDLRVTLQRGLGIGSTGAPGLVTSFEFGAEHRIGREWLMRADGGVWHSGRAPTGADAVTGYAASGEIARRFGRGLRIGAAAAHFSRFDGSLARTTVGLRVGWDLGAR